MGNIMKKAMKLIIMASLVTAMLAGCGNSSNRAEKNGIYYNKVYGDNKATNLKGETVDLESLEIVDFMGLGIDTSIFKELKASGNFYWGNTAEDILEFIYCTDKGNEMLNTTDINKLSKDEAEAFYKEYLKEETRLFAVARIPEDDSNGSLEKLKEQYTESELILELEGKSYYLFYNKEFSSEGMESKDKSNIESVMNNLQAFKEKLCIFETIEVNSDMQDGANKTNADLNGIKNIGEFKTTTMDGKTFTMENFKDYDITMINIWATWCTSCIKEMPALQELYEKLPSNVNMISICQDGKEEADITNDIISKYNLAFDTIVPDDKLNEGLINKITAFPTTIFVDSKGNIVGKVQVGEPASSEDKLVEGYTKLIEEALANVQSQGEK